MEGVTAHDAAGEPIEGTIQTFTGEDPYIMDDPEQAFVVPTAGKYVTNNITVQPALQDKTVTENGTITPDTGYVGLRSVTIDVATGPDVSGDTVVSEAILEGFTAHNAEGEQITGSIQTYDGVIQNGVVQPAVKSVEFNIAYGDTAPDDTSKLWVKTAEPNKTIVSKRLDGGVINSFEKNSTSLPISIRNGSCASVGKYIYIFGGFNGSYYNTIYKFNSETNSIELLPATLVKAVQGLTSVVVDKNIYLFGGNIASSGSSRFSKAIQRFNTENETIETLSTSMIYARGYMGSALIGDSIYLIGGQHYSSGVKSCGYVEKFSISTGSCSLLGTLDTGLSFIVAVPFESNIFVFGNNSSNVYKIGTAPISMETMEIKFPASLSSLGGCTFGNDVYLLTSEKAYKFNLLTKTIEDLSFSLPTDFVASSCALLGNKAYFFGGYYSNVYSSSIYIIPLQYPLETGNVYIKTDGKMTYPLIKSETFTNEVEIDAVYIGNADGVAEKAEAYLHNGTEWVQI